MYRYSLTDQHLQTRQEHQLNTSAAVLTDLDDQLIEGGVGQPAVPGQAQGVGRRGGSKDLITGAEEHRDRPEGRKHTGPSVIDAWLCGFGLGTLGPLPDGKGPRGPGRDQRARPG